VSLPRRETIDCPKCGSPHELCLWANVNVTTDPDLKREVLDGSIAHFVCRTCRYSCKIEYDLLYHDMTKHIAVWLKYPVEGGFFSIDPVAASMSDVFGETYIRRVVPSYEELVEKIRIADAGFDDCEIELVKLFVCIREQIDITEPFVFAGLKTSLLGGTSVAFTCVEDDKSRDQHYPLQNIESTITKIRPLLRQLPRDEEAWPYVNRGYVLKRLSDAGLMRHLE